MLTLGKLIRERPSLWPVERFLRNVVFVFAIIDLVVVRVRGVGFDWFGYTLLFTLGSFIIAIGLFYRTSGRSERIAMALIATGMLVLFTMVLSIFNYLLLPLYRDPIDPLLAHIDSWFGYSWPSLIEFAGHNPLFNEITRYAYLSTLPQMAVLVIILGFGGKQKELHEFMFSITVSGLVTIGFWAGFPAFGTSVLYDISGAIEQTARPLVGSAYGAELLRLGTEGPTFITPKNIEGLVAFPSYHTVMAILAVYSARTLGKLFPIMCVINLFVLPGVLIHGGHHLIDVFGGILTALGTLYLARHMVIAKKVQPDGVFDVDELPPSSIPCRSSISSFNR